MSTRFAGSRRRRAASAILVLVTVPVIVGFAALTIDVGLIYNTRVDLQNAADAAAMAATHAMTSEAMMQVRMGTRESLYDVIDEALTNTASISEGSRTFGGKQISIETSDVTLGWINTFSATEPLRTAVSTTIYNAVRVEARRTQESANGAVQLWFARIFGHQSAEVTASAVAVFDDRFSVFDAERDRSLLWPFTKHIDEYEAQLTSGGDDYGYDADADAVTSGADGTREVDLYPGDYAPGNYGLLNIGPTSLSNDELNAQIANGITTSDLEASFGSSELSFYDESGSPTPYDVAGNTGMKSDMEDVIKLRVGDIVGFFVHDLVTGTGANARYRIVGMRWGQVMHAALQSSAETRGLWIQPIAYDGPGVGTNPGARPTRGGAGRIVLAR
jgi:Flp pilus assembly protein TadG